MNKNRTPENIFCMRKHYYSRKTRHIVKFSSIVAATLLGCEPSMAEETSSKKQVAIPSIDTTKFVYNGSQQTYSIANDSTYSVIGGTHLSAGKHEVTVSLNDPSLFEWEDGSIESKTYDFVISKLQVEIPSADTTPYVYNGNQQTYSVAKSEYYSVEGFRMTDAGNHNVVVSLNDTTNCEWADSSVEDKNYTFKISKAKIEVPSADTSKFTYTGISQLYAIAPSSNYSVSGNIQTNAGKHIVSVSLADTVNYEWTDGISEAKTFTFEITKATVEIPTAIKDTFEYDGEVKYFEIVASDKYTTGITNNKSAQIGTYQRSVSINDTKNYMWADSTTETKIITFVIKEGIVKIPTENEYAYTGSTISLVPENPAYNVENGEAVNAGEYVVRLGLNDGYIWSDGTKDTISLSIRITPILVDKPNVNSGEVTYDGSTYSIKIAENSAYGISGDKMCVEPGIYKTIVSLKPNHAWSDTTTEDLTYQLKINRIKTAIPSVDTSVFYYSQKEQTLSIEESVYYSVEGNKQTEIGIHDVVVTLNDTIHHEWSDGSAQPKHFNFAIVESEKFEIEGANVSTIVTPGDDMTIDINANGMVQYYKITCDKLPELKDTLREFDNQLQTIQIPTSSNITPGIYKMKVTLVSGTIDTTFTIDVAVNYPASDIIVCWNDVVAIDHSKVKATTYQWHKNGELIPGATDPHYCDKEGLCGYYMCKIDGGINVGPAYLNFGRPLHLSAYGTTGKIIASVVGSTTAKVYLMNVGGMVTDSKTASKEMTFNVKPGIYVLVLEGTDQSVKVVVK